MRLVHDVREQAVIVYELVSAPDDPEPSSLVFEWPEETIRYTSYPANWRTLRDEELLAIGVS